MLNFSYTFHKQVVYMLVHTCRHWLFPSLSSQTTFIFSFKSVWWKFNNFFLLFAGWIVLVLGLEFMDMEDGLFEEKIELLSKLFRSEFIKFFDYFKKVHSEPFYYIFIKKKLCRLIGHTISESLVKIQYFRHECSSIMYINIQKLKKNKGRSITCGHIWHIDTPKCV